MKIQFMIPIWATAVVGINAKGQCGSSDPPAEAFEAIRELQTTQADKVLVRSAASNDNLLISTYVHIVEREQDVGFVTDTMLDDQMRVLNQTFLPHRIQFVLKDVSHSVNDTWASSTRNKDKQESLRRGGYDDLNIYFESGVGREAGFVTGLCEFPVSDPWNTGMNGTSWSVWDGCHVSALTMPGGPGVPGDPEDNQGKTATHEVGHWFGLFHVFQGNDCNGEGDLIDDTPVMLAASEGCNIGQDSCPDHEGLDPIHNYMDYSSNPCQYEFTPLQEKRMYESFDTFRKGK